MCLINSFLCGNSFLVSAIASGPPTSVTIVTCCDWNGDYRLNLLPHPTNCEAYYHCETKLFQDGRYGTIPTSKDCPLDEKGNRLHFDFLECRCLRNNEAVCYDGSLSGHFSGIYEQ